MRDMSVITGENEFTVEEWVKSVDMIAAAVGD
jgi:hypothetical protein